MYNSLLSNWDRQFMNDCVHEVIYSFDNYIIAYIPLPEERQKNFDKDMREYNGPILFYKKIILAERTEIVQGYNDSVPPEDIDYGRRDNGELMYSIPDDIPIRDDNGNIYGYEKWRPDIFMIFQIDNSDDRYYVRSIKDRIGQCLLTLYRYDGTTPNGIDLKDIQVIEDSEDFMLSISMPELKKTEDSEDFEFNISVPELKKIEDSDDLTLSISAPELRKTIDNDNIDMKTDEMDGD